MSKDYYNILGVGKNADETEIKKAYRKLSKEHHPDLNPDNKESEEKFKSIVLLLIFITGIITLVKITGYKLLNIL